MKRIKSGSGMTESEGVQFDLQSAADWTEMAVWLKSQSDALTAAVTEGGGLFGASSLTAAKNCAVIAKDPSLVASNKRELTSPEDGPVQLANLITHLIEKAKAALSDNRADAAASWAFEAGKAWGVAQMKWRWDEHAMRGVGTVKSAAKCGDHKHGKYKPDTRPVLNEMDRLRSAGHSKSRAAALTFTKGLGTSKSANEGLWKRHRGRWRDPE